VKVTVRAAGADVAAEGAEGAELELELDPELEPVLLPPQAEAATAPIVSATTSSRRIIDFPPGQRGATFGNVG